MDILTYDILFSLLTLTFLEIVLGIDNLIFIAIVTTSFLGDFKTNPELEKRFWNMLKIQSKEC